MVPLEDDSDMKIAGMEEKKRDDTLDEAKELEVQKKNGNIEKARKLGKDLSAMVLGGGTEEILACNAASGEQETQQTLLLIFTVGQTVETAIKSKALSGIIMNVFYDALKEADRELYDDIAKTGALSFYALCARQSEGMVKCIRSTFAMLSGKEEDPVTEELGEMLYRRFSKAVSEKVELFNINR